MSLSERDKSELLGLVSGFGTAESDARARSLAERDPEAAEHLRQMWTIAGAFRPPARLGFEQGLSDQEADEIATAVINRAIHRSKATARQRRPRWLNKKLAVGGIAAALALAFCAMWVVVTSQSSRSSAPAGFDVVFVSREHLSAPPNRIVRAFPGDSIKTGAEFARFSLSGETAVVLYEHTSVKTSADGKSLALEAGWVFIDTPTSARVRVGEATTDLQRGKMVIRAPEELLLWYVYEGTARITVAGESHEITVGQQAFWNRTKQSMKIIPFDGEIPEWAVKVLEIDSDR